MPSPIVTIFGGSGFIGRYVARRMARAGWRVRVAVRRPNEALFVRTYGVVGQVEPVQANVRDEDSTRRAIAGATAVVNCVGIMVENGRQTFDAVQDEGAARIARLAAEAGATRFVHVSAIGADPNGDSLYARSKAAGEAAVLAAFPKAVILRPSIIFGVEDQFFNRFGRMARLSPVVPIVSPDTRFQPVYVDDVAAAAEAAARGEAAPGIYELGGPDTATFRELMERMLGIIRRRRLLVTVPTRVAALQGSVLDFVQRISFGAFVNEMLTRDQVRLLAHDNVVAPGARGLADLGVEPTAMAAILESYLYPYRPGGQYAEIKDSAAQLRG
ncbi:complex I NDUFA9 subunit family protein [Amaricoccus sp.]|uniref:complex I NDUFA9 subunit family protein n=1 Tax=Amaricoccus sp. TaxID=1872485 RepID=UPI001B405C07|nr:complex I NDUFA9 subunit family protein [Amaricoccus sp.]MBP7240679.1 complex I NDUFA9 subunit family protein [Amaricoccus sp.]